MISQLVVLSFGLCLLSIDPVFCSFFCKDSTIDSITYARDTKMYFIASGGHYWWIKEAGFPPKDGDAKSLETPFTKTTAAVYVDSVIGCPVSTRAIGMRRQEKEVWVTEIIDGKQKLMSWDTRYGKWGAAIDYDQDHCISKARIDFDQPIDAMFTRNYLEIYLVQGDKYAMVDCHFLCNDPENKFGDEKPESKTSDFGTKDPIYGMLVIADNKNEKLLMFQKKVYYVMEIKARQSINGKVIANKIGSGKDILTDFLRIKSSTECTGPDTPPPLVEEPTESTDNSEAPPEPENPTEQEPGEAGIDDTEPPVSDTPKPDDSGSGLWIIIAIIVIVLIVVAVGLCLLFAMKAKKTEDTEASKPGIEGGVGSKTGSKTGSKSGSKTGSKIDSQVGGPSKAGGSPVSPNKSSASSKIGSTMSTRSGMGKSTLPKSSAGGVKSSASKK